MDFPYSPKISLSPCAPNAPRMTTRNPEIAPITKKFN